MVAPARMKKSNDYTGRQAEERAKKSAEEQKVAAEQMAMVTATEQQEFEDTVHDMTGNPAAPTIVDEVVDQGGVSLSEGATIIRVAEDVEHMTYGHGNEYTFRAGGRYKVPRAVADRLQELGLLYDRL
jgi:altronate dehydratase